MHGHLNIKYMRVRDRRRVYYVGIKSCLFPPYEGMQSSVSQTFLLADHFWLRKITMDPHILAHVNTEHPDGWYLKLKIIFQSRF